MCGVAFKFKFLLMVLLGLGLISTIGMNSYPAEKSHEDIFKEVERIELDFGEVVFASVSIIVPVSDGFVILINETPYTTTHTLLKFSKAGKLTGKYDQRGNGPGEIKDIGNIVPLEKSILVSESSAPYVHEFSNDLKFIKDYRIKKGGNILLLGKYIGIWGVNYIKEQNKDKIFMLELYDRILLNLRNLLLRSLKHRPMYIYGEAFARSMKIRLPEPMSTNTKFTYLMLKCNLRKAY